MPLPTLNSYSYHDYKERSVSHYMWQCDFDDLFFIDSIGGTNGADAKFRFGAISDEKIEWRNIGDRPTTTTVVGSVSAPTTTGDDAYGDPVYSTHGSITVVDASIYTPTMVLELVRTDGQTPEAVHINSINYTTNVLSVTRGWRGTPVYAYSNGQLITILTMVAEECQVPYYLRPLGLGGVYTNYFQIITSGWEDTLRRQKLSKYYLDNGNFDPAEEEMRRLIGGTVGNRKYTGFLPKILERTALYGIPAPSGPNGDASMGGLNSFPINQLVTSVWDLAYFKKNVIAHLYRQGANIPNLTMMMSPDVGELISDWGQGVYISERSDTKVGIKIESIITQYGEIKPVIKRDLRPGEIYLYDPAKIGMKEAWGWTEAMLPSETALCFKHQVHGCWTLAVACMNHHMRIRLTGNGLPAWVPDRNPAPAETLHVPEEHGVVAA